MRPASELVNGGPVVEGVASVELIDTGGMTPDASVETVIPVPKVAVKLPNSSIVMPVTPGVGTDEVRSAVSVTIGMLGGGMTPSAPVLFNVAVIAVVVKFAVPTAVVMTSVTTVGVTMPFPPVELKVAVDAKTSIEALPAIVVFETTTITVSDDSAVITVGVSTPLSPVDVMVNSSLETTTRVLVLGP